MTITELIKKQETAWVDHESLKRFAIELLEKIETDAGDRRERLKHGEDGSYRVHLFKALEELRK